MKFFFVLLLLLLIMPACSLFSRDDSSDMARIESPLGFRIAIPLAWQSVMKEKAENGCHTFQLPGKITQDQEKIENLDILTICKTDTLSWKDIEENNKNTEMPLKMIAKDEKGRVYYRLTSSFDNESVQWSVYEDNVARPYEQIKSILLSFEMLHE